MKATHDELEKIDRLIDLAFDEDIAQGDLTTESIFPDVTEATALLTAKAPGIISGIEIAQRVLDKRGSNKVQLFVNDGDSVQKGDKIMAITASYATLLTAERLLLNFMQRMSGIATETHRYVTACEGTNTHILDTRKTAPGLRLLDKMAVRHGGGRNHRMGLYDMIMLKDNHIKAVGSITKAVEMVHSQLPLSVKVEVETTCLKEVEEALSAGADEQRSHARGNPFDQSPLCSGGLGQYDSRAHPRGCSIGSRLHQCGGSDSLRKGSRH